ncbi:SUMF1/EgtB/PvdO family nonheme iron enzyme [Spirulina sp. CCNP1310]|uniref:bifunctional serine/threonine-protein kinase/formylglycine-generating enzyme family protein n=1 Tax=Spirulina sp. CCNP1310 TaxID=3110249 RepID=UPI002B221700|nr:SUMF1/EgtB/PvdO family nonheme iron enzyme [Spirulina sp. CCNP1310]MEA5421292.1 SUMF1/EgtB/PvdO family nonheme iron enzyme [Spirulina sp. CCNP1310]
MRHCLNPVCRQPNPDGHQFCQRCGNPLLLRGRYWAKEVIGQGGFGRTFLAVDEDKPSKPFCVIKQFLPQDLDPEMLPKAIALFEQEAQQLEILGKHSQIPELFAYFIENNQSYLIQEFINGITLKEELANQGVFSEQQIRALLVDLLNILAFVHEKNVIHRDIKPENIIRRRTDQKLVLVDFGAAKVLQQLQRTVTGTRIGSAEYCAPEQGMGKARFNSDLYSLGVTCLHLLTQVSPFDLYAVHDGKWVWRDYLNGNQVSENLGKILDRLVEQASKKRYQSTTEVLVDLDPTPKTSSPAKSSLPSQTSTSITRPIQTYHYEIITLNEQGGIIQRQKGQNQGYLESAEGLNLEMVRIPAGEFMMGAPKNETERSNDEGPQHRVIVPEFFMGRTAITQAQWQIVAQLPQVTQFLNPDPSRFKGENNPVETVSWEDCIKFCLRLSQATGKFYRLPSEAEWEYACRAGTTTPFHFGPTLSPQVANYDGNHTYGKGKKGEYRQKTIPVGSLNVPNTWGLHDMHGNVWEWCLDDWHGSYQDAPTDGRAWIDNDNHSQTNKEWLKGLLNNKSISSKLLRGGSWGSYPKNCRFAFRSLSTRVLKYNYIGFRVVAPSTF